MGQKVNPIGLRIGINRDWSSRWYADDKSFAKNLDQDIKIRRFIEPRVQGSQLSRIDIDRVKGCVTVTIFCGRPGAIMGQDGADLKALKAALLKHIGLEDIKISIVEIRHPDLDAHIMAQNMATQLEARSSSRIVQKRAIQTMMKSGAKGCKTMIKGRVNGAEIARSEQYREGVLGLHTLDQNIDYALAEAKTTYGRLGCKVWIALPSKEELEVLARNQESRNRNRYDRRGPRNNNSRDHRSPAPAKKGE